MTAAAFQELFRTHRDRLVASLARFVGNRDEAEDITAAAFMAAFKHRREFREEASFYSWLYRIAMNNFHSRRRRRKFTVSLDALEEFWPDFPSEPDMLDRTLVRSECCRRVREVLRRIPKPYRRVLVDRFVRGHSTRQMARQYKVPEGTVLSRVFTGKRILREAWESSL